MKKLVLFATLGLFLLGIAACGGGGKYADAREAMEEMIVVFDDFGAAMEKADDGKTVAAAIEEFADKMEAMKGKMEELEKKYPELKDQKNVPEELKDLMPKVEEATKKMIGAMGKIMQYASDPEVAKLMERLQGLR
jgi:hypothetical protein